MEDKRNRYWDKVRESGRRYSGFHWPSAELVLNIVSTYYVLADIISRELAGYGLSRAGFNVLMILSRSEGKLCKHRDIGRLMFVSRANITGLVDSLVRQGFVERRRDAGDRRVWLVAMTSEGEALLKKLLPAYYRRIRQLCTSLPDAEKKNISRSLRKWRTGLDEFDDKKI